MLVEQSPFGEQECPRANTGRQLCTPILRDNPVEQPLVVPFSSGTLSAWDEQDIKRRGVVNRIVWLYQQPTATADNSILLSNGYGFEEDAIITVFSSRASRRENL